MRPIDADALTDYLKCLFPERGMWEINGDTAKDAICETVVEAMEMVKNMETVKPEPNWIPCSERLPEDGKWCIFTDGDNISVERYKFDALDHFLPPGRWFDLEDAVAWMPLPAPYREEGEE